MALTLDGTNGIVSSGSITTQSATGVIFSDSSSLPAASSPYVLKNRIINGAMVIDQRYAGAATANTIADFTLDRWSANQSVTGKIIVQQNAAAVTPPAGFNYYLGVTSQSSYALLTGSYYFMQQSIEGYNVVDLAWGTANAKTITISFWVRSSLTGTFSGALTNSAANRSYPFSYTISVANTWEQKSVTIAGDTSGTWLNTSGAGIRVNFSLGTGTTYSGTAGAWASAFYVAATGATSVVGTNGATFYITGVQLEIGSTATPFERRLYNQELANCQRYYYKIVPGSPDSEFGAMSGNQKTTVADGIFMFPVTMRTPPAALEQTGTAANYALYPLNGGARINCSSVPLFSAAFVNCAKVRFTVASGLTAGQVGLFLTGSAAPSTTYLAWSAEL